MEKYLKADGTSGYDALNRLTNVDYGDGQTQSYTFDAMGNRLSRQDSARGTTNYACDAANRLTSTTGAGASSFNNDADGNTLTGGERTNAWDSQTRMVSSVGSVLAPQSLLRFSGETENRLPGPASWR